MAMAGAELKVLMALVMVLVTTGIEAQVHHVVGGDRGWDPSSDITSWSSGRLFRVGDTIWFTYSVAHDSIVEMKSVEEYESCNLTNPIRMYTDGLNTISLDGEGIRYFASGNPESCKNGLKLHVDVQPQGAKAIQAVGSSESTTMALAAGPTPSASTSAHPSELLLYSLFVGLLFCYTGL